MKKKYIIQQIKNLSPWYQTIDLDGEITTDYSKTYGKDVSGEVCWRKIKTLIPESLEGKRILDIGCNAGYYCIQSSIENCNEYDWCWPGKNPVYERDDLI